MTEKNIKIHIYFYWLLISAVLSFVGQVKPFFLHTGISELSKKYLIENIAPVTYEASMYLAFVLVGLAGFFYVYRTVTEIKLHKKALFHSLNAVLRIGGVFSGIIIGAILYACFYDSSETIPLGIVVLGYLILFTMVPPWITSIILGEIENRRNNIFSNKTSLTVFRIMCISVTGIGLYGLFDISTRFIA